MIHTRIKLGLNNKYSLAIWDIPLEERVLLAASVYENIQDQAIKEFLDQLMIMIEESIEKNNATRENVLRLLKEFKKMKIDKLFLNKNLLNKMKFFFVYRLNWLDDVEYFLEYSDLYPEYVYEDDMENVEKQFLDLAISDFPDDPDTCREEADKISYIAQNFDVDVSRRIEALEERARELEEGSDEMEYANHSGSGSEDFYKMENDNYCTDSEIISIFESLDVKRK